MQETLPVGSEARFRGVVGPAAPLQLAADAAPVVDRLRRASRDGRLPRAAPESLLEPALAAGLVDSREAAVVRDAAAARLDAIQVDVFSEAEYFRRGAPERVGEPDPVGTPS